MKEVFLITDGSCIGNPGPGGWACILRFREHIRELYGSEVKTTNNRMELKAVVEGLKALREPCSVVIYTDSEYVKNGMTDWIKNWKRNGWQKASRGSASKGEIKNKDLWIEIDMLASKHDVRWEWVKGHSTHTDNNRCDFLANQAARNQNQPS